jgi:hypothetical protein
MKRPSGKIKKVNQLYAAAVKGDSQVTWWKTWPLFADAQGDAVAKEFPDLLHPNQAGYEKWAAATPAGLRPRWTCWKPTITNSHQNRASARFFNGRDLTGWGYHPTSESDRQSARKWQATDSNAAACRLWTSR